MLAACTQNDAAWLCITGSICNGAKEDLDVSYQLRFLPICDNSFKTFCTIMAQPETVTPGT
jgi:hypothetical protein